MMNRQPFSRNIFTELDRFQRDMQQALGLAPAIRGSSWGGFPAMNMGHTADSILIYVFVPGINPDDIDAHVDKGILVVAGERKASQADEPAHYTRHIDECFSGRFRRIVTLPDDVEEDTIQAHYQDGVLTIKLTRRQPINARKIDIQ